MADSSNLQTISGRLERGEIDSAQFLDQFTRYVAAAMGCSRAGVWVFSDTDPGHVLRCLAMYDATLDHMVTVADMVDTDVSVYFDTLLRDGSIIAPDALAHPAMQACRQYLIDLDVRSSLDVCFSVNGVLFGTFSCEQIGSHMEWSQRQIQRLRKIGSRASLTLMHAASAPLDTAPGALWDTGSPSRLATLPMPLDGGGS